MEQLSSYGPWQDTQHSLRKLFVVVLGVLAELWGTQPEWGALLQFAATTSADKVNWIVGRAW